MALNGDVVSELMVHWLSIMLVKIGERSCILPLCFLFLHHRLVSIGFKIMKAWYNAIGNLVKGKLKGKCFVMLNPKVG